VPQYIQRWRLENETVHIHSDTYNTKILITSAMANLKLTSNILEIVCRVCLKMHEERYNIFEHSEHNRLLADMVIEIISIQVLKDDGLPKTICTNCFERLKEAYDFKTLAVESNEKLRSFC
ncbi:zinc-finger associated domain containing protein, partial [Oryctes borbonicus]